MQLPDDDDDDLMPAGELDARTAALQAKVSALRLRPCTACGAVLCGHGALLAVVLGCQDKPRCAACLAGDLRESSQSLAERALQWIQRRDCFLHVWRRAGLAEGLDLLRPACHFEGAVLAPSTPTKAPHVASPPIAAATWDAGDLGCGDLVLELRSKMRELPPGAVLHLVATDPAAPVDLPAWCGLVGHTLLSSLHPHYDIQRKRD